VTSESASNDLIRDPFLNATSTRTTADKPAAETIETAMPWLKAEMDQPKVSQQQLRLQQPRGLISSQDQAENSKNPEHAPKQASTPSVARTFDTDPKRLEAGLLRVNLKHLSQLGLSSAQEADDNPTTSLSLRKRLELAWRSLRHR
jgi:hypothetical protein